MTRSARLPGPVPRVRRGSSRYGLADPERARQAAQDDPRLSAALDSARRYGSGPPTGEWRSAGLCNGIDPEVFFPLPADDPAPVLKVCRDCPVQGACLAAALEMGEVEGIWGATRQPERRWMRAAWLTLRAAG